MKKTWGSHKATGEYRQHHSFYFVWESLARLLRQWVNLCLFSFVSLFNIQTYIYSQSYNFFWSAVQEVVHHVALWALLQHISNRGYGRCTRKLAEALSEAACPQRGAGMRWRAGPGSIWVPSSSPWPHPDKKQTNQQNKRATETDHMLELGKQQSFLWYAWMYGLPQMTQGGNTACFCPSPTACVLWVLLPSLFFIIY